MLKTALVSTLLVLTTYLCHAAPILTVTATANAPEFPGFDTIGKTADLSNLTGNTFADVTDNPSFGYIADGSAPIPVFDFDLGGSFLLSRLGLWNIVGENGNNVFGLQDVSITSSTDGLVYNPLTGAAFLAGVHTFALAPDTFGNGPEIVNFDPVVASFVRFTVISNYNGDNLAGLNTVMFDGLLAPAAPELNPSAANLPLCFMSLLVLAGVSRRNSVRQG